ncbi:hypothetical protein JOF41_001464 [Saccharothrix coeruleofusca]|nr:hypothetical protein [Saccharothrix coeruleofusca]
MTRRGMFYAYLLGVLVLLVCFAVVGGMGL